MSDPIVAGLPGLAPAGIGAFPGHVGPLGGSSGGAPPPPPASGVNYIVKPADQTKNSSNVLSIDNDLHLSNVPIGTHAFECWLDFVEANSTMGAQIGFAGMSAVEGGGFQFPSGGAPSAFANQNLTGPVVITLSAVQLRGGLLVDGYFTMAAQATFSLLWSQAVSNAGNLTLKAGSWLKVMV